MENKKFEDIVKKLKKTLGEGVILDKSGFFKVETLSTGITSIDYVMGGGFPKSRLTELYGEEGAGKSTVLYVTISNLQKSGGVAVYLDLENTLDLAYLKKLGVDEDKLIIIQPDTGDQTVEIVEKLIMENVDLVVVDSVAAMVSEKELDGKIYDDHVALQARLMSQALRRITGRMRDSKTSVVFINQIRENVGVMFGNPETTPGGRALKFYASVRIEVRRGSLIKDANKNVIGNIMHITVTKNKISFPYRKTSVSLIYGKGIEDYEAVAELLISRSIIENPKHATYKLPTGEEVFGKEKVIEYVKNSYDIVRGWLFDNKEDKE